MGTEENGWVYDELVVGDKKYPLRAGVEAYLEEVEKNFPTEVQNVKNYLEYVKQVVKQDLFLKLKVVQFQPLAKLIRKLKCQKFFESVKETALEVVKRYTKNEDLHAFLLGQYGDHGIVPSKAPFYIHALIANHYLYGGYFPKGGSSVIAENLTPTIEKNGGAIFVRKAVQNIIIRNNRAVGVKMTTGEEVFAKNIVSAAGVPLTWDRFVPKEMVPRSLIDKIKETGMSECSFLYAFIGIDGNPEDFDFRSSNIWHLPHKDFDKLDSDYAKDPANAPMLMFIGTPCAKDSTWSTRYPGKSNCVILTKASYWEYQEFEDKKTRKRGDEYNKKKDRFLERVLEEGLYHYYPKTRGKVISTDVGTPITFNHYLGNLEGACYGMGFTPSRFQEDDWLTPKTHIPGLYMTGQDITTMGILGAFASGIISAHSILGYGTFGDLLSGRNLIEDIMHLEKKK